MNFDTKCLHAGYRPGNGEPRNIPIIQSTTFRYETSEDMGKLFDLEASGYFYTRLQNPTSDAVAARLCALEGGTAAMLLSSGQAASFFSIFNIASAGDHVVASSEIYGGTYNLFAVTMKRMGIDFTFVDPDCSLTELERGFPPQHEGPVRRDHCQPRPHGTGHRKVRQGRPRPRGAPHRGQHLRHPLGLPALRVGGGHRHPLHHQIPGRPRRRRGRRHRGLRQVRLGRPMPTSTPA